MANYAQNRAKAPAQGRAKTPAAPAKAHAAAAAKAPAKTPADFSQLVTAIKVWPTDNESIVANVSVVFGDCFIVTGLQIVNGRKGLFVSMPRYKVGEEYKDRCFPLSAEFREYLTDSVLMAYAEEIGDDALYESLSASCQQCELDNM